MSSITSFQSKKPKNATTKPKWKGAHKDSGPCINHLQ